MATIGDIANSRREAARNNVRRLVRGGARQDEVVGYLRSTEVQNKLPGITFKGLMGVEPDLAMQRPELQTPEGQPREPRAGRLGDVLSVIGAIGGPAASSARFLPQVISSAAGAFGGRVTGDVAEAAISADREISPDMLKQSAERGAEDAAISGGIMGATVGLGNILSFLRGAPGTPLQKQGAEFAQRTKAEGRPLPARASDFAERTLAGKIDRGVTNLSTAGKFFLKQQGQKVARFLESESLKLSGRREFVDPSNIVQEAAPVLKAVGSGEKATKLSEGVGRNFENPSIWLNEFFSPANRQLIQQVKSTRPDLFEEMRAAWFQSALRESVDPSVRGSGILVFNGNQFRAWFEGNRKVIRETFGETQEEVMDNFTSYMKFASSTAKRAFAEGGNVGTAAPAAAETAVGTFMFGDLGAGLIAAGAWEGLAGALAYGVSRPSNPIYKVFAEPFSKSFPKLTLGAKGVRAGAIGAGVTREE